MSVGYMYTRSVGVREGGLYYRGQRNLGYFLCCFNETEKVSLSASPRPSHAVRGPRVRRVSERGRRAAQEEVLPHAGHAARRRRALPIQPRQPPLAPRAARPRRARRRSLQARCYSVNRRLLNVQGHSFCMFYTKIKVPIPNHSPQPSKYRNYQC